MIGKGKGIGAVIVAGMKEHDEGMSEAEFKAGQLAASSKMLAAIKANDAEKFAEAMKEFHYLCDDEKDMMEGEEEEEYEGE